jgi:hypothetical protein
MARIIKKVYQNKKSKQKLVTIPKKCDIKVNDFVEITKLKVTGGNKQ